MNTIKNTINTIIKGLFKPDNKLSLIPNWLSFSRAVGGIAIPIMAYTNAPLSLFFSAITFLAISDFLDGKAARIIAKGETKEGAMLDAVSDKLFSIFLIIGLLPTLPIFAINGALEGIIALINGKTLVQGGNPKSNLLGKIKIWPLSIALILGYLALIAQNINIPFITKEALIFASTLLSISTMPLEIINIKEYLNNYHTELENQKENITVNTKTCENEKENTKKKTKQKQTTKFALSKKSHQAIIYELPQEEKQINKTFTKKINIPKNK